MADTDKLKDRVELSLDSRQIFYLFFGGAVLASMVFVLGVVVGKRIEARTQISAAAQSPDKDPLAALDKLEADRDKASLTFASTLRTGEVKQDAPLAAVAKVDAPPMPDKAAAAGSGETPAAAEPVNAEPAVAAPEPAAKVKPGNAFGDEVAPTKAKFTLQLSSFRDEADADSFHDELRGSGYAPYVIKADVPNKGTWYRVRLGHYATYQAALAAKAKFEKRQQIIAYVTRKPDA